MRVPLAAVTAIALAAAAPAPTAVQPACRAAQLSPSAEATGGVADDGARAGTRLVLRNLGPDACQMPGLPLLRFEDARHRPLPATRRAPPGMHPGPVVLPVEVAAGARIASTLRWVPDGGAGTCVAGASLAIAVDGGVLRMVLPARLCGPPGADATFDQTPLRPDPAPP